MTRWIRWQGLIVFLIASIIIGGLWFFLIDSFIERAIEKTGTLLNGAKVDLDHADLSIIPAGLVLTGVQVTNPDRPLTNAVEIKRLALSLDGLNLLLRKVIVEEMSIEGVQFNTPRKTSGAIDRSSAMIEAAVRSAVCGDYEFKLPSFEIPDVNEILKSEDIRTVEIIDSLQADILSEESDWRTQLNELPDQETFDEYRKRIKSLASNKGGIAGIFGKTSELKSLHKEIQDDLKSIRKAQKGFNENLESFKERVEQAAKEPLNDLRRLTEKYDLSPQGLENLSQRLLSVRICEWVQDAKIWYDKLKPAIERAKAARKQRNGKVKATGPEVIEPTRAKGADVHFTEYEPMPDFLIRHANVSATIELGEVAGKFENLTLDQDLVGEPLTFAFSGRKLKGLESAELSGEFNHVDTLKPKNVVSLQVDGFQFEDLALAENEEFPITLEEGMVDVSLDGTLSGEVFDADIIAGFQAIRISTELREDASPLERAVLPSLLEFNDLNVAVDIFGTLEDYGINISSDFDRVLKNAFDEMVKAQAARFESELKAAITEYVAGPIGDLDTTMVGFSAIGEELTDRLKEGSGLLKPPDRESGLPFDLKLPF